MPLIDIFLSIKLAEMSAPREMFGTYLTYSALPSAWLPS